MSTRELQEMISARENYDTRKVNNRAENVTIDADVLEQIEESGITSEQLDALNVPVFRYKTQITLHGIFPALENSGRLGGNCGNRFILRGTSGANVRTNVNGGIIRGALGHKRGFGAIRFIHQSKIGY